jgi:hypothetical protein
MRSVHRQMYILFNFTFMVTFFTLQHFLNYTLLHLSSQLSNEYIFIILLNLFESLLLLITLDKLIDQHLLTLICLFCIPGVTLLAYFKYVGKLELS